MLPRRQAANCTDLIIGRGENPLFKIYDSPSSFVHTLSRPTKRRRVVEEEAARGLVTRAR